MLQIDIIKLFKEQMLLFPKDTSEILMAGRNYKDVLDMPQRNQKRHLDIQ